MSLKDFLDKASEAYYTGNPIISDEEFDTLAESCNYGDVGYAVEGGVKHPYRMYSLQKFYEGDKTQSPLKKELLVETPKLDGAAIALLYLKGKLVQALTRGDGITGMDISHLLVTPNSIVPQSINSSKSIIQVVGEVVAPKEIPNSRNYASGALGLKSADEFRTRTLYFIAYGAEPYMSASYLEDLKWLSDQKFSTVLDNSWDMFPQDGKVYRLDSNERFKFLGYTASHPRGAYALKVRKQGVVTKLLGVTWSTGRTGAVSPVAHVEPVEIDGATVSKATLHNYAYITSLNLEIGCEVEIVRAGDIIPRIIRRVD